MSIESKLDELGLHLPKPPEPIAAYVPCLQTGNLLYISGQLPLATKDYMIAQGPVPSRIPVDQAQSAAVQCVVNALAIAKQHLEGDLTRIAQVVRVGVFVQSDSDFHEQALVANGASELLEKLFGDKGKHVRAAVGVNALPKNASVEVEFIFEVN